ncbi:hypothetical protein AX16_002005 [Volvariella volvacea WC 439]|nr:hypothetical protein AX16_002005 [Volvariella volvacea WC 439]
MVDYSTEKYAHDEVNLYRLLRRLEKSAAEQDWNEEKADWTWIHAQGVLQKVKFARKLLKNVEIYGPEPTPEKLELLERTRARIEKVEAFANKVEQRTAPKPHRPEPILPTLPLPPPPTQEVEPAEQPDDEQAKSASESETAEPADNLLMSPSEPIPTQPEFTSLLPALIPSTLPSSKSSATTALSSTAGTGSTTHRFAQNSSALQQELSDQLAQMATQLKRNAIHFSNSLEKDAAIVEETQQKLESNFDMMQKERVRLRDHSSKSTGTTCYTVFIVIAVLVIFMFMVSLIRFTRF